MSWQGRTRRRSSFSIEQPSGVIFTWRGLLSKLASVFDPLGLASPVRVQAKIKLKLLSLVRLLWDSEVPKFERRCWENWLHHLASLNSVLIPRCLQSSIDVPVSLQLHTFTDASEEAFAAAVYFRSKYPEGRVTTRLLMAKAKLAPRRHFQWLNSSYKQLSWDHGWPLTSGTPLSGPSPHAFSGPTG